MGCSAVEKRATQVRVHWGVVAMEAGEMEVQTAAKLAGMTVMMGVEMASVATVAETAVGTAGATAGAMAATVATVGAAAVEATPAAVAAAAAAGEATARRRPKG